MKGYARVGLVLVPRSLSGRSQALAGVGEVAAQPHAQLQQLTHFVLRASLASLCLLQLRGDAQGWGEK